MKTWSYFILGLIALVLSACGSHDEAVRGEKHNGQECPGVQKRISDLLADIDEEGNNYVIIGKMK